MKNNKRGRSTEQAITDLISFCNQNKKYPTQNSDDPYEKSLAVCISNYKRNRHSGKNAFTDKQFDIVQNLQSNYSNRSLQKNPSEKLEILRRFCMSHGYWPSQASTNEDEKKIYETCCRTQYYIKDPTLLSKYNSLKDEYLSILSPSKVVDELRQWIQHHKTTPRESSKNEIETRLAKNIKYLKSTGRFSDNELNEITYIYTKFGPRGGTSIFEQILYYYLLSSSNNSLISNRNSDRFGFEVDILIESISKTVAVFYDGSFFHQDESKDNSINKALSDQGIIVLRFQEEGCPTLSNCISIPVEKGIHYQDFLNVINKYFTSSNCPIRDIISTEYIDSEEILRNACIAGSSNYLVRGHLLNYIENALLTADKPKTDSKIYRNCKACLQRNQFTDKEILLYAFTKRLYDSSPRKRRSTDVPSVTNDDIELLSQIIDFFYKNTPNDHIFFKEILIAKINDIP